VGITARHASVEETRALRATSKSELEPGDYRQRGMSPGQWLLLRLDRQPGRVERHGKYCRGRPSRYWDFSHCARPQSRGL
jgi:hypothetical protein